MPTPVTPKGVGGHGHGKHIRMSVASLVSLRFPCTSALVSSYFSIPLHPPFPHPYTSCRRREPGPDEYVDRARVGLWLMDPRDVAGMLAERRSSGLRLLCSRPSHCQSGSERSPGGYHSLV
jgi:hypothetical protein